MNAHQDNPAQPGILPEDEVPVVQTSSPVYGEEELPDMEDNPSEEPSQETQQQESDSGRKFAGVYQSVEDLERGYKELQAEYTRLRQAQKAMEQQAVPEVGGEQQASPEIDPVTAEVMRLRHEMEWQKLEREYGPDIRERVAEYYQQLSPEEQMALDNPAGARLIAKLVTQSGGEPQRAIQPTGAPKGHVAPKPRLTRAEILNMSPEEYQARQAEIMEFYAQQGQS